MKKIADNDKVDPVYRHSRREAVEILLVLATVLAWSVGYCAIHAYKAAGSDVRTVLGMPAWVTWGIVVPWAVVAVFACWYSLFRIRRDNLDDNS